ncbi:MAG: response regulator transcription factor [Proteobacteria bacterium]|nr:response regulator transcription factor [Pseudomonadota bacterium]
MYHVLIIEDHSIVAHAAADKIKASPLAPTVEMRATADEALSALRAAPGKWDLILLDLEVPGATGLSLASDISRMGLAARTCVLTASERTDYEAQIAAMGFQGYLLKGGGLPVETLQQDLLRVVAGEKVFRSSGHKPAADAPRLTRRQAECLGLAAGGLTTKQIASELDLHPGTVDRYIHGALLELRCSSRAHAIARAIELGLIAAVRG